MNVQPLRVVFAGTPDFAAAHLQALIDSRHHICSIYTQPDRPAGRGRKLSASPVKQLALANDLQVFQPTTLKTAESSMLLQSFDADIMIVVAYGIILPADILVIPKYGCINVHASLLPRWRGAAPIQRAIEAGDKQTGVTIMQMDAGLDTGDMLLNCSITIDEIETSESLHNRLMNEGSILLLESLDLIAQNKITSEIQDETKASYAKKLTKAEAAIDWSLSAVDIGRKIRAHSPWPGSYISLEQQKMKIIAEPFRDDESGSSALFPSETDASVPGMIISADESGMRVACGSGSLLIKALQMPGKKMIPIAALLNSYQERFRPGLHFER